MLNPKIHAKQMACNAELFENVKRIVEDLGLEEGEEFVRSSNVFVSMLMEVVTRDSEKLNKMMGLMGSLAEYGVYFEFNGDCNHYVGGLFPVYPTSEKSMALIRRMIIGEKV